MSEKNCSKGNSLPNYIINMKELAMLIYGTLYGDDNLDIKGIKNSKGFEMDFTSSQQDEFEWTVEEDTLITGVNFGVSDCRNIGYIDYWDMYIDGKIIMDKVYVKEMYEYKQFRKFTPLREGSVIKFIFNNISNIDKTIWFDLDYIV